MGRYIETPGISTGKAARLQDKYAATTLGTAPASMAKVPGGKTLVCAVKNSMFEAVAVVFDDRELRDFNTPEDHRPRTWLLLDSAIAEQIEKHGAV